LSTRYQVSQPVPAAAHGVAQACAARGLRGTTARCWNAALLLTSDYLHTSPLKWEHINLTGDYHWRRDGGLRNRKLRPLRSQPLPIGFASIAVGMPIAEHPPHRSRRA
jgi:hypothetical protein